MSLKPEACIAEWQLVGHSPQCEQDVHCVDAWSCLSLPNL